MAIWFSLNILAASPYISFHFHNPSCLFQVIVFLWVCQSVSKFNRAAEICGSEQWIRNNPKHSYVSLHKINKFDPNGLWHIWPSLLHIQCIYCNRICLDVLFELLCYTLNLVCQFVVNILLQPESCVANAGFLLERVRPPCCCTHYDCTFPIMPLAGWAKLEEAWPGFTSAADPEHLFRHRQESTRTPYSLNLTPLLTGTHSACVKDAYAGGSFTSTFEGKNRNHPVSRWSRWLLTTKIQHHLDLNLWPLAL